MRIRGIRRRIYRMVYDKPALHRQALQFQKSLEEVKRMLCGQRKCEK